MAAGKGETAQVMITFLNGIIAEKQPTRVVMDVGGVGYEVAIPLSSYDRLPAKGQMCRILTYHHVREDAQLLFGFMTEDERRMFLLLISISGIGPKTGLTALSGMSARELKVAIVQGDVKRLNSISGIGKKTAERMVIELKDKISEGEALEAITASGEKSPEDMKMRDAVLALIALGYKQDEARKMVAAAVQGGTTGKMTVEEIVKKALGA
jgi:Holliday junction DNA helicase RuvA